MRSYSQQRPVNGPEVSFHLVIEDSQNLRKDTNVIKGVNFGLSSLWSSLASNGAITSMFAILTALVTALSTATFANAHGYVQDVVVGSTHYTGYLPYSDPYYSPPPQRIIRAIPGNG